MENKHTLRGIISRFSDAELDAPLLVSVNGHRFGAESIPAPAYVGGLRLVRNGGDAWFVLDVHLASHNLTKDPKASR